MALEGYSKNSPIHVIPLLPYETVAIVELIGGARGRDVGSSVAPEGDYRFSVEWTTDAAALSATCEEKLPRAHFYSRVYVRAWATDISYSHNELVSFSRRRAVGEHCQTVLSIVRLRTNEYAVIYEDHTPMVCRGSTLDALLPTRMVRLRSVAGDDLDVSWPQTIETGFTAAMHRMLVAVEDAFADVCLALRGRPAPADIDPATGWVVTPAGSTSRCTNPRHGAVVLYLAGSMPRGIALAGIGGDKYVYRITPSVVGALTGRWTVQVTRTGSTAIVQYELPAHPFVGYVRRDMRWAVPPLEQDASDRALVPRRGDDTFGLD